MATMTGQIKAALDAIFSVGAINEKDRPLLKAIQQEIHGMDLPVKRQLADDLLAHPLPSDNAVALHFFLYDCFFDLRFLECACKAQGNITRTTIFNEFFWNISQRTFTNKANSPVIADYLRTQFTAVSSSLQAFLQHRGLVKKRKVSKIKRIAILSPQLLGMHHSPTREAFNIALHLQEFHQCESFVFNTNGMNAKGINQLGLASSSEFQVNPDFQQFQKLAVKYMGFDTKVNIMSFAAGEMNTQKVAQIADCLNQFDIDAIISHGENLLVMDALYGSRPSLFATTGSVVPYQHCDAYFVPADLMNTRTQAMAEQYGHSNFMSESMLVTPEGIAEKQEERSTFGIQQDDFVYLVVGTRLEYELCDDFVATCEALLKDSTSKIIFAGSEKLELSNHFSEEVVSRGQVQNIGFHQNIAGVCAMCDAYLNPKRLGGGTSAQTAIINGLPVISHDYGHISVVLPSEYRYQDWANYQAAAMAIRERSDVKNAMQGRQRTYYTENSDAKGQIARMYDKLCEVSSHYKS